MSIANIPEMGADVFHQMLDFLNSEEIAKLEGVNKVWKGIVGSSWRLRTVKQSVVPEQMIVSNCWKYVFIACDGFFGPKFYEEHLGKVGPIPPIPQRFIEMARIMDIMDETSFQRRIFRNYQLVFVPESITITVERNSALTLNNNNQLIEDEKMCRSKKRNLKVPLTLNNLAMLVAKCLKQEAPIHFDPNCWENVFEQHGDISGPSRWIYHKITGVLEKNTFTVQEDLAEAAGLKVVTVFDRVLLNVLSKIRTGKVIDEIAVRTASCTVNDGMVPRFCYTTVQGLLLGNASQADRENFLLPVALAVNEKDPRDISALVNNKKVIWRRAKSI